MLKYNVFEEVEGNSVTLTMLPDVDAKITENMVHVYSIVARDWVDAMTVHNEIQGFGPYKEFTDELSQ